MDVRRIRPGDALTGVAGLLLLAFLFIPWYGVAGRAETAFEAFAVTDVLLVLAGLGAVALPVVVAAKRRTTLPVGWNVAMTIVAPVAVVLVAAHLVLQPGDNALTGLRAGAWMGLLCTLLMTAGAWWAMRDERSPHVASTPPARLKAPAA